MKWWDHLVFNPFWFDWGAGATLVTGAAAVYVANQLGKRQLTINERQAAISERQTELTEVAVRISLVAPRTEIWEAARQYLQWMIAYRTPAPDELRQRFRELLPTAKRLFPPPVPEQLGIMAFDADRFAAAYEAMVRAGINDADPVSPLAEAFRSRLIAINVRYASLTHLFERYVDVSDAGSGVS